MITFATNPTITTGENIFAQLDANFTELQFDFTPGIGGTYIFSDVCDNDLFAEIYDASGDLLASNNNQTMYDTDFSLGYNLVAGTTYTYRIASNTTDFSEPITLTYTLKKPNGILYQFQLVV